MGVGFTKSAFRHGFTPADILSAIGAAEYVVPDFEDDPERGSVWAWVGPAVGGRTIEVFAHVTPPSSVRVFHCMEVRYTTMLRIHDATT